MNPTPRRTGAELLPSVPGWLSYGHTLGMPFADSTRNRKALRLLMAMVLGLGAAACRMDPEASASVSTAKRVTIGDVQWYVDYDAALAIAREQDKALWLHFGENPG